MFSKLSVDLLKSLSKQRPRQRPIVSCSNNYSMTSWKEEKSRKEWKLEFADPKDHDRILCFVENQFLKNDPLVRALIPGQKPWAFQRLLRQKLDDGLTVVARSCCDCDPKEIVGVSINARSGKLDGVKLCEIAKKCHNHQLKKLFEVYSFINLEPKLNETLCQDEIFHLALLSVSDCHYGKGIGLGLVQRSLEIGRDRGFDYAKMNCTSDNTRKLARQLKMQKFWSASYKDILCRGSNKPEALPEPPHNNAIVFFMDLKKMPKLCWLV